MEKNEDVIDKIKKDTNKRITSVSQERVKEALNNARTEYEICIIPNKLDCIIYDIGNIMESISKIAPLLHKEELDWETVLDILFGTQEDIRGVISKILEYRSKK